MTDDVGQRVTDLRHSSNVQHIADHLAVAILRLRLGRRPYYVHHHRAPFWQADGVSLKVNIGPGEGGVLQLLLHIKVIDASLARSGYCPRELGCDFCGLRAHAIDEPFAGSHARRVTDQLDTEWVTH
jgi:hypothetical protein